MLRVNTALLRNAILVALISVVSASASAGTWDAFGPRIYVRGDGAPVTVTASFSVRNPNTQYTLHLSNGLHDGTSDLVSSTVIAINGTTVVSPNDLNQNVLTLDRPVLLAANNTIDVQVRGAPGGTLSVEIIGIDNDPPTITASSAPTANANGWNNAAVTVSYTCNDATSGVASCPPAVTVSTEGAGQNVTRTATDLAGNSASSTVLLNIDETPPTISASITPLPNAAGWNNAATTVSFTCSDALSGIASCSPPQTISSEGDQQLVSGSATDLAGNAAGTNISVRIDETPPVLTISSPADGSTVASSSVTITGSVADSMSGASGVLCNGASAVLSNSSFNCTLTLQFGTNQIAVSSSDIAGNIATRSLAVTFAVELNPPPSSVTISPSTIAMAVGETRNLSLVDNLGRQVPGAAWSVTSDSVLQIGAGDPPPITGLAAGQVIVTANYQGLTSQAAVTVFAGTDLPENTVRWTVAPLPGFYLQTYYQSSPSARGTAALLTLDNGSSSSVRGFRSDGTQIWMHTFGTEASAQSLSAPLLVSSTSTTDTSSTDAFALQTLQEAAQAARSGQSGNGKGPQASPDTSVATSLSAALVDWGTKTGADDSQAQKWLDLFPAASPVSQTTPVSTSMPMAAAAVSVGSSSTLPAGAVEIVMNAASADDGNMVFGTFAFVRGSQYTFYRSIVKLDGATGNELWRYISPGSPSTGKWAVAADGTIYVAESDLYQYASQAVVLDGATGVPRFTIPVPQSYRPVAGVCLPKATPLGFFMVADDGSAYIEYQQLIYSDVTIAGTPCQVGSNSGIDFHEALNLLHIGNDGTTSTTSLFWRDFSGLGYIDPYGRPWYVPGPNEDVRTFEKHTPSEVVPDGSGGLLATFNYLYHPLWPNCWDDEYGCDEGHIVHIDSTGTPAAEYVPIARSPFGPLVVGENGTAYANGGSNVVAFDVNTGTPRWSWVSIMGNVDKMYAAADGALVLNTAQSGIPDTVVRLDAKGDATVDTWTEGTPGYSAVQYHWGDEWYGFDNSSGSVVAVDPAGIDVAASPWFFSTELGTRATDPGFKLVAETDFVEPNGIARNIVYRLRNQNNAIPAGYTVYEYLTDIQSAPPYGTSPHEPNGSSFFEDIGTPYTVADCITRKTCPPVINLQQYFSYQLGYQRRYAVWHIERTVSDGQRCKLKIPVLQIRKVLNEVPLLSGVPDPNRYPAPYMGVWPGSGRVPPGCQ